MQEAIRVGRDPESNRAFVFDGPVMLSPAERFCNPFAFRLREDCGTLRCGAGWIEVAGDRTHVFDDVSGMALVRQAIPWLSIVLSDLAIAGMSFGGLMKIFTPTNPFTWVMVACLNVFVAWATVTTKWIRASYRDSSGAEKTIYLLPVNDKGRRRFDGATDRLFAILVDKVGDA